MSEKVAGGNLWSAPSDDARFKCDDGVILTWGEMTRDLEADYDTLMFCFGTKPMGA